MHERKNGRCSRKYVNTAKYFLILAQKFKTKLQFLFYEFDLSCTFFYTYANVTALFVWSRQLQAH
jgi:hypothetical protein